MRETQERPPGTVKLFILATVRNPALVDATLLVFKTLRVGFPNAVVSVHGNGLEWFAASEVQRACSATNCSFCDFPYRSHDAWIEQLLREHEGPFWICDTDLVFLDKVEHWFVDNTSVTFAGRYEPEFEEEFTNSRHMSRLHTALMYFNTTELRLQMREWMCRVPAPWGLTAQMNLVRQQFVPLRGGPTLFFDTTAGLYHAELGTRFTPEQDACFEHLHCGTYADKAGRAPSLKGLQEVHKSIYEEPARAAGLHRAQAKYYASRRPDTLVVSEHSAALSSSPFGKH